MPWCINWRYITHYLFAACLLLTICAAFKVPCSVPHIDCVFVCCRCVGLFLSFNFHLSRPDIPTNVQIRTMDICTGWPTVTDLSPLFGVASRRALCDYVCVCVRRSHTLFCYFLRSMAVAANISVFSLFLSLLVAFTAHRSSLKTFNCILPWK